MNRTNSDFLVDGYICTFAKFKPGEVHKLTGMTPALQRLWKRRGQMPLGYGDPEPITARVVAEVYVRHQLALAGLPPSESADIAAKAAQIVLWFGLLSINGACAVMGPKHLVADFIDQFMNSHHIATKLSGVTPERSFRYLYRFGGIGPFHFALGSDDIFNASTFTLLTVLDLETMGNSLAIQAGRPLLTVEIPSDTVPRSMWERRLVAG